MSKNNKKIYRPKTGTDLPDAPNFDPVTMEPVVVNKRKALNDWFKQAKKDNITDEECYQGSIDPKQAFYARKKRKQ